MNSAAPLAPRFAVPDIFARNIRQGFDRNAPLIDLCGETMGTQWRVRMAQPSGSNQHCLHRAVQAKLDAISAQMSHWDETSLLCRFNTAQGGSWTSLPPDFARVMACALDIAERSGGAFDPALGRLTDVWGLGPGRPVGIPAQSLLNQARRHSGWQHIAYDADARRLRQPGGVWLDLSGIAKGFATDAIADLLSDHGVFHALVEIGGECAGRGIRPDGDPWWIEIETPAHITLPPLRVALHHLAVATSGDYLQGAHTLDPATGFPAIHNVTAVSVIAPRCMEADGWASALSALPPQHAQEMATRQNLAVRMVSRDGSEWLSDSLLTLLR